MRTKCSQNALKIEILRDFPPGIICNTPNEIFQILNITSFFFRQSQKGVSTMIPTLHAATFYEIASVAQNYAEFFKPMKKCLIFSSK